MRSIASAPDSSNASRAHRSRRCCERPVSPTFGSRPRCRSGAHWESGISQPAGRVRPLAVTRRPRALYRRITLKLIRLTTLVRLPPAEVGHGIVQHAKDDGAILACETLLERREPSAHRLERGADRLGGDD